MREEAIETGDFRDAQDRANRLGSRLGWQHARTMAAFAELDAYYASLPRRKIYEVSDLVTALNRKAEDAGADIKVEQHMVRDEWADYTGVLISGSGDLTRAVDFVRAYFTKRIRPNTLRGPDVRYTFQVHSPDAQGRVFVSLMRHRIGD